MAIDLNSMTVAQFVNIQGIDVLNRSAIMRGYKNADTKSYDKWYSELSSNYAIGDKKVFTTAKDDKSTSKKNTDSNK